MTGILQSIARKIRQMTSKIGFGENTPLLAMGGLSKSAALIKTVSQTIGLDVITHQHALFAGAVGAYICAESKNKNMRVKAMRQEIIITFPNTHHAIAGEQALLNGNIPVKVMPMPGSISAGCGICLRIPPEEQKQSIDVLITNNVTVQGIYLSDNGTYTPIE